MHEPVALSSPHSSTDERAVLQMMGSGSPSEQTLAPLETIGQAADDRTSANGVEPRQRSSGSGEPQPSSSSGSPAIWDTTEVGKREPVFTSHTSANIAEDVGARKVSAVAVAPPPNSSQPNPQAFAPLASDRNGPSRSGSVSSRIQSPRRTETVSSVPANLFGAAAVTTRQYSEPALVDFSKIIAPPIQMGLTRHGSLQAPLSGQTLLGSLRAPSGEAISGPLGKPIFESASPRLTNWEPSHRRNLVAVTQSTDSLLVSRPVRILTRLASPSPPPPGPQRINSQATHRLFSPQSITKIPMLAAGTATVLTTTVPGAGGWLSARSSGPDRLQGSATAPAYSPRRTEVIVAERVTSVSPPSGIATQLITAARVIA